MRKSTLFISAALTTFMLAVMFGVASAYQKIVQTGGIATESSAQQVQSTDMAAPALNTTAGAASSVTLEEAATLASSVIGRTDLYASENTQLDGVDVYLVTFSSGDLVYVSLDGKIISISKLPVNYVLGQAVAQGNGGGGGGNNGGNTASDAPAASALTSGNTGGGGDHSNEDNPNNTADHANEDHPVENDD